MSTKKLCKMMSCWEEYSNAAFAVDISPSRSIFGRAHDKLLLLDHSVPTIIL